MAPRTPKARDDAPETDRIEGQPHPRESFDLIGQQDALGRAARAIRGGRPPQGWIICGPPGIGKATLAYRIARYILRYGASDAGPADLEVSPQDSVSLQVAAGSHPGLLVLKRAANPETGRMMSVLSVAQVRRLSGFFGLTSGAGGWRAAIIDTADDLNDAAANALLKMLEEPPARSMLLLLSHAPGRLLPTIRSRCQRLLLRPLAPDALELALAKRLPDIAPDQRASLVRLAGGSLGLALQLASSDGLALAEEAERLVEVVASPDLPALLTLADRVARAADGLERFGDFLKLTLSARIRVRAGTGGGGLKAWVLTAETIDRFFARANALHLEPRQTILSTAHLLSRTAQRHSL